MNTVIEYFNRNSAWIGHNASNLIYGNKNIDFYVFIFEHANCFIQLILEYSSITIFGNQLDKPHDHFPTILTKTSNNKCLKPVGTCRKIYTCRHWVPEFE